MTEGGRDREAGVTLVEVLVALVLCALIGGAGLAVLDQVLRVQARMEVAAGQGGQAVSVLEELVQLDPLDGEALLLLGKHYGKKGQSDRAIFYYERAASIEAFEVEAKVRHAQVLVGMSRCGDAVPLLRRAQQVKPREEIARYLEQVERVARTQR